MQFKVGVERKEKIKKTMGRNTQKETIEFINTHYTLQVLILYLQNKWNWENKSLKPVSHNSMFSNHNNASKVLINFPETRKIGSNFINAKENDKKFN